MSEVDENDGGLLQAAVDWAKALVSPASRGKINTVNKFRSVVCVHLCTDLDKPIREERVMLVLPSGDTRQENTDESGNVEFSGLPVVEGTRVLVVLPDILEAWNGEPSALQFHFYPVGQTKSASQEVGSGQVSAMPAQGIETYQAYDKDEIERLHDSKLTADNAYRKKDRTKYSLLTQEFSDEPERITIKINRLTEAEKFLHFRELLESNNAWYQAKTPFPQYYTADHRFRITQGAVCNQMVNFFLGFWFNHNSAFTTQASATSFLKMLEDLGSTRTRTRVSPTRHVRIRGFTDIRGDGISTPTDMEGKSGSGHNYIRISSRPRVGRTVAYDSQWDDVAEKFTNADLMSGLSRINVYSVWDGKRAGRRHEPDPGKVDHHGGLLIKADGKVKKLAADGFRYKTSRKFSHTLIEYKAFGDIGSRTNLYLRIWPMPILRDGGYAAGDATGDYKTDVEMASLNTISPHFHHSVSRFIQWSGLPNVLPSTGP